MNIVIKDPELIGDRSFTVEIQFSESDSVKLDTNLVKLLAISLCTRRKFSDSILDLALIAERLEK